MVEQEMKITSQAINPLIKEYVNLLNEIKQTAYINEDEIRNLENKLKNLETVLKKNIYEEIYKDSFLILSDILRHLKSFFSKEADIDVKNVLNIIELHKIMQTLPISEIREHIIHSLKVFLLGISFLNKNASLRRLWEERMKCRIKQLTLFRLSKVPNIDEYLGDYIKKGDLIVKIYKIWIFISLLHDIGYVIKLLNKRLSDMFPHFEVTITPKLQYEKDYIKLTEIYSSFFSTPSYSLELDLQNIKDIKDHGYMGSIFSVSQNLFDAQDIESSLYLEALFTICFHNKPYLGALSPFLQLLVFADSIEEMERYLKEEKEGYVKLMSNVDEILIKFEDTNIEVILSFRNQDDAKNYFDKFVKSFSMPDNIKSFINSKDFPKFYESICMKGLEFKISCQFPKEKDALVLFFHGECGRLSSFCQIGEPLKEKPHCTICSS
jgi:hypothetical protein